jgi:hypothetical protein
MALIQTTARASAAMPGDLASDPAAQLLIIAFAAITGFQLTRKQLRKESEVAIKDVYS